MSKVENVELLTGFIVGVTSSVRSAIKENRSFRTELDEEVISGLRVFTFIRAEPSGQVSIIFQLGTDHLQVDEDSYIARNTVTVSFGPEGVKLLNSRTYGCLVTFDTADCFKGSVKQVVEMFSDVFPD